MKNFTSYARQNPSAPISPTDPPQNASEKPHASASAQPSTQNPSNAQKGDAQTTATAEELTKRIARSYNGKSNALMLRNILAEAEKSKRAGTLSNEEIEAFYQSFAPMLNATQKRQLRAVVEKLKEI